MSPIALFSLEDHALPAWLCALVKSTVFPLIVAGALCLPQLQTVGKQAHIIEMSLFLITSDNIS